MSKNIFDKADVILLGAGCANLSLAARANELINYEFTIIDPGIYTAQNHIWGFWRMPWLANTKPISRKCWYKWKIISENKSIIHSTEVFPYTAINSLKNINLKLLIVDHQKYQLITCSNILLGTKFKQKKMCLMILQQC
jgi:hypothetical protein